MKICFVTANAGKVASMREHVAPFGLEVDQVRLDLVEPQADSVEDVALAKAQQAHAQLKAPVVVEDSGFYVRALNGFPGPYTKYALSTIGVQGLLRLLDDASDRTCGFTGALADVDVRGVPKTFVHEGDRGTLAGEIDRTPCEEAWSDLWRVFIPAGSDKPLSALGHAEREAAFAAWGRTSVFAQFARWIGGKPRLQS